MNKFIYFCLFLVLFSSSCKKKLLEEFNNGNSDPSVLVIAINGLLVRDAIESAFGLTCKIKTPYSARIITEVRTATFDEKNNTVTIDPNPYEGSEKDVYRQLAGGLDGSGLTKLNIMVPEKGAYQLRVEIELDVCSKCCQGQFTNQCTNTSECGKPKVIFEKNYMSNTRPLHDLDLKFESSEWKVRQCYNCGCSPCI